MQPSMCFLDRQASFLTLPAHFVHLETCVDHLVSRLSFHEKEETEALMWLRNPLVKVWTADTTSVAHTEKKVISEKAARMTERLL